MKIYYFKKIQNYHFEIITKYFQLFPWHMQYIKYKHKMKKKNIESHGLRDPIAYLVT